jgi:fructose/tagatose bisphosphate aldolase
MEQLQGIVLGCAESKSPVILQVSGSARKYADPTFLPHMAKGAVQMINAFGGKMDDAVGIPEEQLRKAARSAVCKINIDSDGRLAMTAIIRKVFAENPAEFDPRKYLGPAREELIKMVKYKNEKVLGSAGKV